MMYSDTSEALTADNHFRTTVMVNWWFELVVWDSRGTPK